MPVGNLIFLATITPRSVGKVCEFLRPLQTMAVSFWIIACLVSIWLIYRFLRLRLNNRVDVHRQRVLQQLGLQQEDARVFLGFFHPYW